VFPGNGKQRWSEGRIAELERKIGQQALELDFLKGCLQRIEEQRMLQALTGKPQSTGGRQHDVAGAWRTLHRICQTAQAIMEARRADAIGRLAVYAMLEHGILPGIRLGRRWNITRYAYAQSERTCGMRRGAATSDGAVPVLNQARPFSCFQGSQDS
jgi:hypothetical protein